MAINASRRVRVEMDLTATEAWDLLCAIGESRGYLLKNSYGGWHSDPRTLMDLEQAVKDALGVQPNGVG